jgi:hypothetical protein
MRRAWRQGILALPGVGVSVLPKFVCPVCWPAYAGLLSSLGLSFLVSTRYLMPLTGAFLVLALAALGFRANRRRGYGPFHLGLVAAIAILLGKFVWESTPAVYSAVGFLALASVWNAWPPGRTQSHTVRIHVPSSQVK